MTELHTGSGWIQGGLGLRFLQGASVDMGVEEEEEEEAEEMTGRCLLEGARLFVFSFLRSRKTARWRRLQSALKLISPRAFNASPFCILRYISCTKHATSFG